MAQTLDAKTSFRNGANGLTSTWSHTVAAGAKVLVVRVTREATAHGVTGVTVNGVAMTLAGQQNGPTSVSVGLWYLLNPPSGSLSVVASHDSARPQFDAASFLADGSLSFGQWVSENVTAVEATTSLSVTPAVNPSLCVEVTCDQSGTQTAGGNQAGQVIDYDVDTGVGWRHRSSHTLGAAASATTFTWSKSTASADTSQGIAVFSETAGGTDHALAGSTAGIGRQSGALTVVKQLAGASAGVGAQSGALVVARALSGAAAGIGGHGATLVVGRALVGSSEGAGDTSGALVAERALGGAAPGLGGASGALIVDHALSGASSGVGGAVGELEPGAGPADHALAGATAGAGGLSGALALDAALGGTSAATGDLGGAAWLSMALGGTIPGVGGVSGHLGIDLVLAGASTGAGGMTGAVAVVGPILYPPPNVTFDASAPIGVFGADAPTNAFDAAAPPEPALAGASPIDAYDATAPINTYDATGG